MRSFDRNSTVDEVLEGIDLSGQVALVTGGTSGLGAETARGLASRGAAVTLTARDVPKGEGVAAEIRQSTGNDAVDVMELVLHEPDSVRAFAKGYLSSHPSLNLLVNNAGIMACPLERTAEGWELQFATNHLGHFLLTCLLAPALRAGAPARVVSVSSAGHRFSPVVLDDVHFENRPYDKFAAYGQSKSANILFAVELDRRLAKDGVRANAIHPGMIVTELGRHLTTEDMQAISSRGSSSGGGGPRFKSIPAGAATQVYAATAPELEGHGGLYLEDCQISGPGDGSLDAPAGTFFGHAPWAKDAEAAKQLWSVSQEMLGERFDL